jgi:hypothetical protein
LRTFTKVFWALRMMYSNVIYNIYIMMMGDTTVGKYLRIELMAAISKSVINNVGFNWSSCWHAT